jgi:hypothetical protein
MFPRKLRSENLWSEEFEGWDEIPLLCDIGCVKPSIDMIKYLHTSNPSLINAKFLKTWNNHMHNLSTYSRYNEYIDGLYEVLRNTPKTFEVYEKDLKKNWLEDSKFVV